jgi:hypothetical protein
MIHVLFVILVVLGFGFHFLGTFGPTPPYSARIAWGSWFVASLIWAVTNFGS